MAKLNPEIFTIFELPGLTLVMASQLALNIGKA